MSQARKAGGVLNLNVKYGTPAAVAATVIAFVLIGWLMWPPFGIAGAVVALFMSAILFVVSKSYVDPSSPKCCCRNR